MCDQKSSVTWMIGVDGGGTKTEFALFNSQGEVLKTFRLGGANSSLVTFEGTLAVLSDGINRCLQLIPDVRGVFIGIAGGMTREITEALQKKYPGIHIRADSDSINAFHSAEGDHALICGTGTILVTKTEKGYREIGGWGAMVGDFGSAFNIGRDGARYAFAYEQGIHDDPSIREAMLRKAGVKHLYYSSHDWNVPYIASLSTAVFECYHAGCKDAETILKKEMQDLSKLLDRAFPKGGRLVVCGGVMEHNHDILLPMLQEFCQVPFTFVVPEMPPVYGACVACCKHMGLLCGECFKSQFADCYSHL